MKTSYHSREVLIMQSLAFIVMKEALQKIRCLKVNTMQIYKRCILNHFLLCLPLAVGGPLFRPHCPGTQLQPQLHGIFSVPCIASIYFLL
jgi:hypothetical protein